MQNKTYNQKIENTTSCPVCECITLHENGVSKFCDNCDFDINYTYFEKVEHLGQTKALEMLIMYHRVNNAEGEEWEQVKEDFHVQKASIKERKAIVQAELEKLLAMEEEMQSLENRNPAQLQK